MDEVVGLTGFSSICIINIWQLTPKINVISAIKKKKRILYGFIGTLKWCSKDSISLLIILVLGHDDALAKDEQGNQGQKVYS